MILGKILWKFFMDNFVTPETIRVSDAIIQLITFDRDNAFITIAYTECTNCNTPELIVTLVATPDTVIEDESGEPMSASDLHSGMTVSAIFSSAMTRSIPPQAVAFQIRLIKRSGTGDMTTSRIISLNTRNQFILTMNDNDPASIIRFNVSPNTIILDTAGRQIPFSRLVAGLKVNVQHAAFLTASIPPQTTAFVIQITR